MKLPEHNVGGPAAMLKDIGKRGVFSENPVLVQALAFSPVLFVTTSLKNGLLLAAATFIILVLMGVVSALVYRRLPAYLRSAVLTLIAAALVTPLCLLSQILFPNVTKALGMFLPLVAVNGIIFAEAERCSRQGVLKSAAAGAALGAGFGAVLIAVSAVREILGYATLYDRALPGLSGFSFNFALLPPGALLLLACLLAIVQHVRLKKGSKRNTAD